MPPVKLPEQWKPVPGWSNYEVSDLGRVRSKPVYRKAGRAGWRWSNGKILKATLYNYRVTVSLHNESGDQWTAGVATLVLRAFVRPPNEDEVARHYNDPDPTNCRLSNLRWGTQAENVADEQKHYGKHHKKDVPHTEETKAKIGAKSRGRKHTEETKARMRESAKLRPSVSKETKSRQSAAGKARWAKLTVAEKVEITRIMVEEAARIKRGKRRG